MPTDNKRLAVPEKSIPYQLYFARSTVESLLNGDGVRRDGRKPETQRPFFIKTNVVSQAKGSSYIEVGKTKVICSVFGPRELSKREDFSMSGSICCELKFATFSEKCRRGNQQDSQEKDFSLLLQETLQPAILLQSFPKCQVDIFVTILENGGGALSTAVTAASLALVNAGIQMYDVVVGASIVSSPATSESTSVLLVDPTDEEELDAEEAAAGRGRVVVGFMPSLKQVAGFHQIGAMSLDDLHAGVSACVAAAEKLFPLVRKKITESLETNR